MIKLIHLDMTEPKIRLALTLNKLNIFVGTNGVGKSFLLKNLWALSMIVLNKTIETAQYIYDRSFENNLSGSLGIETETGSLFVEINSGKVISVKELGILGEITPITFMSSDMRSFDSISLYLKMRKALGNLTDERRIEEMSELYKLYDVLYIEKLIKKCPITVDEDMRETLENYDIKNITEFSVDLTRCDFYILSPERTYLTTLGKGHQSLINMFIGNL